MTDILVDQAALRAQVQQKYREVALEPDAPFHFHTGRSLATRLGYPAAALDRLPDAAVESFAGVGSPFALRDLESGARVVDVGCGAGFDTILAAYQVGPDGRVIGVDMTPEMLAKARRSVDELGLHHVEIREGLAEQLPVDDNWADVVISNGVINLCPDKATVFAEIHRVLRPGGTLQFADIANGNPVPDTALRDIDLWTGWIAGGLPRAGWQAMLEQSGFDHVQIGPPYDTFGEARGEANARAFAVFGYTFLARAR